jgi:hypothetical protein
MTDASAVPHGERGLTYHQAVLNWNDHQPDRAWVECGFQWPPLTIARPRCCAAGCGLSWPCPPALAADTWLAQHEATRPGAAAA